MESIVPRSAEVWSKCRWGFGLDGVSVAGWLLGGGYLPPKTNQFGLGIDNVVGYQVVLPSGEIKNTELGDQNTVNLFQALRVIS
jgi:hypothetical protein